MTFRFILDPAQTLATLRSLLRGPGEFERGIFTQLMAHYNRGWGLKMPTLEKVAERMVTESQKYKDPTPSLSPYGEERFYSTYASLPENEIIAARYAMFPAPHLPLAATYIGISEVEMNLRRPAELKHAATAIGSPPPPLASAEALPVFDTDRAYHSMQRTFKIMARPLGSGLVADLIPDEVEDGYYLTKGQNISIIRQLNLINISYISGMHAPDTTEPSENLEKLVTDLYHEFDAICHNRPSIFDPTANALQLRETLLCIAYLREIFIAAGMKDMCNNVFATTAIKFLGKIPTPPL